MGDHHYMEMIEHAHHMCEEAIHEAVVAYCDLFEAACQYRPDNNRPRPMWFSSKGNCLMELHEWHGMKNADLEDVGECMFDALLLKVSMRDPNNFNNDLSQFDQEESCQRAAGGDRCMAVPMDKH